MSANLTKLSDYGMCRTCVCVFVRASGFLVSLLIIRFANGTRTAMLSVVTRGGGGGEEEERGGGGGGGKEEERGGGGGGEEGERGRNAVNEEDSERDCGTLV